MIIDSHTHVLPPRVRGGRSAYAGRDAAFAAIYADPKAAMAAAEDVIGELDRLEIAAAVIANYSWSTTGLCRETNDYILESATRYPERLIPFCATPDLTSDFSLREVERCAAAGAKGIGELRPDFHPESYLEPASSKPFTDLLREHELLLLLHASEPVGHSYAGKGEARPDVLYPFLRSVPDLTVILAHWGGGLPFYTLMPEVRQALDNVYYDTAASPYLYGPDVYRRVADLAGVERVLFGSDFPLMSPRRILKEIEAAPFADEERTLVLGGNAARLLGR
jgi:predicted TIM-barrel fold metal-dependent hydrolase